MSYAEACELATFVIAFAALWYMVSSINAAERRLRRKVRRWRP
jgi:hypothetical protein